MCRREFYAITRESTPLQEPQKIHYRETVYICNKKQAISQYRPVFPDVDTSMVMLLSEISESQATLPEYYSIYHHNSLGDHFPALMSDDSDSSIDGV